MGGMPRNVVSSLWDNLDMTETPLCELTSLEVRSGDIPFMQAIYICIFARF